MSDNKPTSFNQTSRKNNRACLKSTSALLFLLLGFGQTSNAQAGACKDGLINPLSLYNYSCNDYLLNNTLFLDHIKTSLVSFYGFIGPNFFNPNSFTTNYAPGQTISDNPGPRQIRNATTADDATIGSEYQAWNRSRLIYNDMTDSPLAGDVTGFSSIFGVDTRVGDQTSVGIGLGFLHSSGDQNPSGRNYKVESDSNGVIAVGRATHWVAKQVAINARVAYAHNWNKRTTPAFNDDYTTDTLGAGISISALHSLSDLVKVEGHLGWAGSWTQRNASTDSTGIRHGSHNTHYSEAFLTGRLIRKFGDATSLFFDSTLSLVTEDDSFANQDKDPFAAEFGIGLASTLSDRAQLMGRAFVGGIGQDDRNSLGGTMAVVIRF